MSENSAPEKPPGTLQTLFSVAAAFFGVQNRRNRERDFKHGRALHFIVAGVVMTLGFIAVLVVVVRLVLRQAG